MRGFEIVREAFKAQAITELALNFQDPITVEEIDDRTLVLKLKGASMKVEDLGGARISLDGHRMHYTEVVPHFMTWNAKVLTRRNAN